MSYFAQIDSNNVVINVVASNQDTPPEVPGRWIQTSYNTRGGVHYGPDGQPDNGTPLRKNYAGLGMLYDEVLDAFIYPKPFPSWILDENTGWWKPPVPMPTLTEPTKRVPGEPYETWEWDEATVQWVSKTVTPPPPYQPALS